MLKPPIRTVALALAAATLVTVGLVRAAPDTHQYNFETTGRITAFNASARTFVVNSYTVKTNVSTHFAYEESSITANRFWGVNRKGSWIEVKGNRVRQTITAVNVELKRFAELPSDKANW